jgi:hypothetical protein
MVEELVVDDTPETSRGIIGLCSDPSTGLFYAYDESSIFQVWHFWVLAFSHVITSC